MESKNFKDALVSLDDLLRFFQSAIWNEKKWAYYCPEKHFEFLIVRPVEYPKRRMWGWLRQTLPMSEQIGYPRIIMKTGHEFTTHMEKLYCQRHHFA